jgi:PAS domain S-box-containing protein
MEHLLSASPYPIIKVRKDAVVVYANEAASQLLEIWGINKGEKLPSNIIVFVKKAILKKGVRDIEVKEKGYSLTFKSPEDGYVYIYGIDLVSLTLKEKKMLRQEKYKEILPRSRQSLQSADFRNLIDQTAKMVASTIKIESCSIFKIYHDSADFSGNRFSGNHFTGNHFTGNHFTGNHFTGNHFTGNHLTGNHLTGNHLTGNHFTGNHLTGNHLTGNHLTGNHLTGNQFSAPGNVKDKQPGGFTPYVKKADFPAASLEHPGTAADVRRVFDGISIQEIGSFGQTCISEECAGGICVFIRSQGKTCLAIKLQKSMLDDFTPEEVRFLRYVLSLILKIKECKDIETKLKDRERFLGRLLQKVPDPAYFKDVSQTFQSENELFTAKTPSKREREEKSIHELEEMIPTELKTIYKVKNKELPRRVGGFPLIMPDICMFRESEETLKMALEVQKVLWTVVNNSPAVVFLWRNEDSWPVDFVTENVFQFGYTAEDFTSGEIFYGDIIHREDIDRVRAELDYQIKIGSETFRSEHRICTKNGALRWVEERTFIQRNKTGRVTNFQGLVIDITERKAAEEAFEKAEQVKKKEINPGCLKTVLNYTFGS